MKALSKPISSPSRAEKYPTPLMMRFLRSNAASKSRGRSRSSPMFYRSKKGAIESNQPEPSSPKVTCIGQVRIRRSNGKKKRGGASASKRRCMPAKEGFSWGKVSSKLWSEKGLFGKVGCVNWGAFFRSGYCKKVDAKEDSFVAYDDGKGEKDASFRGGDVERNGTENSKNSERILVDDERRSSCTASPPKNALLLTRCRSAPYRSSSLGGRFWGSPVNSHEEGEDNYNNKVDEFESHQNLGKSELLQKPSREDSDKGPIILSGQEISSKELLKKASVSRGRALRSGELLHNPLSLTRSKSEPARTGSRLLNSDA